MPPVVMNNNSALQQKTPNTEDKGKISMLKIKTVEVETMPTMHH